MIELNGVEYNKYLQVPDYYTASSVRGGESESLFGVVSTLRLSGGAKQYTITAKSENNSVRGYFTRAQVELLRALADSGEIVTFNYHGRAHSVRVALDGVNLTMVRDWTDPDESALFVGTVTLIEV